MDKKESKDLIKEFTYGDMVNLFAERAEHQVRRNVKNVKEVVSKIFSYIVFFNSLSEDAIMFNDHPLTDWPILNEFKDFIYPNSIRWKAGDKSFKDVLDRCFELKDEEGEPLFKLECIDYNDYLNALSEFRSFFKKDATGEFVSLASLRVDKSITDVSDFITLKDGNCHFIGEPYLPLLKVTLKDDMLKSLVKDWYFNATSKEICESYFAKLFF